MKCPSLPFQSRPSNLQYSAITSADRSAAPSCACLWRLLPGNYSNIYVSLHFYLSFVKLIRGGTKLPFHNKKLKKIKRGLVRRLADIK